MPNGKYKRLVAEVSLGDVNKPAPRNTRDANDIVHAKGLSRKKRSASRVIGDEFKVKVSISPEKLVYKMV